MKPKASGSSSAPPTAMVRTKKKVRPTSTIVEKPAEAESAPAAPKSALKKSSDVVKSALKGSRKETAPIAKKEEEDDGFGDLYGESAPVVSVLGVNTAAPAMETETTTGADRLEKNREAMEAKRHLNARKEPKESKPQPTKGKVSIRTGPTAATTAAAIEAAKQRLFAKPEVVVDMPKEAEGEAEETGEAAETAEPQAAPASDVPDSDDILEGIHPRLKRPLMEQMKVNALTRIQRLAWSSMVNPNTDVLVRSETGSGKTMAYSLPLLHTLLTRCDTDPIKRDTGTLMIVMVPTRELAEQVVGVIEVLCRNARYIVVGCVHGGDSRHKEKARIRKGIHVLVATPGRLLDHLSTTESFNHAPLQYLVLDEADRLLDMGFERAIRDIMGIIKPKKRALVSATITQEVQRLSHFALRSPSYIGETEDTFTVPKSLRQHYVVVPGKHRLATLTALLLSQQAAGAKKMVVFCSTSDAVEFHYAALSRVENPFGGGDGGRTVRGNRPDNGVGQKRARDVNRRLVERANNTATGVVDFDDDELEDGHGLEDEDEVHGMVEAARGAQVAGGDMSKAVDDQLNDENALFKSHLYKLHGNMSQVDRASVFHNFRTSTDAGILFCTDVASRGLDMPSISWIVHYDPPTDERCYVHRVGRTARIGQVGDSILFLQPHEVGFAEHIAKFVDGTINERKQEAFLYYLAKLDQSGHLWVQSAARLQRALSELVRRNEDLARIALFAYQSYIRAYAGFPRELKRYFRQDELHLGHVANSFAIDQKPSELQRKMNMSKMIKEERTVGRDQSRFFKGGKGMSSLHDDKSTYHPTLVKRQVQNTKEYNLVERERKRNAPKLYEFTEFDA